MPGGNHNSTEEELMSKKDNPLQKGYYNDAVNVVDDDEQTGNEVTDKPSDTTKDNAKVVTPTVQTEEDPYANAKNVLQGLYKISKERMKDHPKQQRLASRHALINGIGDTARALSNLFFTTKGAPNAYDHNNSLSAKSRERMEKARAQRDSDTAAYYNYAMKLGDIKAQENATKRQAERDAITDANNKRKLDLEEKKEARYQAALELDTLKLDVQQGNLDARNAEIQIKRMLAEGRINKMQADSAINAIKASGATTTYQYDPQTGKKISQTTTYGDGGNGTSGSGNGKGNGTGSGNKGKGYGPKGKGKGYGK